MSEIKIHGYCDPVFKKVETAFLKNFKQKKEKGASLSLVLEGRPIVDIWAGYSDIRGKNKWQKNTIANIFSVTKGITAICALRLVDQGKLELDKPVAFYWPEFAVNNKKDISVRMLLNHQAGMVGIKKRLPYRAIYDWALMTSLFAAHKPWWPPGTKHGYHAVSYGWLVGELIRRVSGKTVGKYLKDEIAGPFDIDIQIGIDESEFSRVASIIPGFFPTIHKDLISFILPMLQNPKGASASAFANPFNITMGVNTKAWRKAEIPSANGHSNARALAKIYGILANGGVYEKRTLLSREMINSCSHEESYGLDAVLNLTTRFSIGFMLSQKLKSGAFGPNLRNFGHPGAGGALGFADPDAKLGFGYVMNKMGSYILVDPRVQAIIDAVYDCL